MAVADQRVGAAQPHVGPEALWSLVSGIRMFLGLSIAVAGADLALRLWGIGAFADMLAHQEDTRAARFDHLSLVLGVSSFFLFLGCAVCWLMWQARLAALTPGYLSSSPGWQVGAWFIPIANLWWPYRNMRELGQLYLAARWRLLVTAWWLAFVIDALLARGVTLLPEADSIAALKSQEAWFAVSDVMTIVAAVLAAVMVGRIAAGAAIVLVPEGRATAE